MIATDLNKQQVLDADPRAIQQINFKANLDREGNKTIFFVIEEAKETWIFTRNWKSFVNARCNLIFINIKWYNTTC